MSSLIKDFNPKCKTSNFQVTDKVIFLANRFLVGGKDKKVGDCVSVGKLITCYHNEDNKVIKSLNLDNFYNMKEIQSACEYIYSLNSPIVPCIISALNKNCTDTKATVLTFVERNEIPFKEIKVKKEIEFNTSKYLDNVVAHLQEKGVSLEEFKRLVSLM